MKHYWSLLSAKVDGLARRERLLVLVAAVVCVIALMNALLLDPLALRKKIMQDRIAADSQQIAAMQAQAQVLIAAGSIDPDAGNKTRLSELQSQLHEVDLALDNLQQGLVSPDKMPRMLESMLRKDTRLKLLSLKTLPVSGLLDAGTVPANGAAQPKAADDLPIFRHGVQLTVQGRYLDLMNYLVALEQMPWRMMWGGVTLTAGEFPASTMTLTVYTLSLDKAWLSI